MPCWTGQHHLCLGRLRVPCDSSIRSVLPGPGSIGFLCSNTGKKQYQRCIKNSGRVRFLRREGSRPGEMASSPAPCQGSRDAQPGSSRRGVQAFGAEAMRDRGTAGTAFSCRLSYWSRHAGIKLLVWCFVQNSNPGYNGQSSRTAVAVPRTLAASQA